MLKGFYLEEDNQVVQCLLQEKNLASQPKSLSKFAKSSEVLNEKHIDRYIDLVNSNDMYGSLNSQIIKLNTSKRKELKSWISMLKKQLSKPEEAVKQTGIKNYMKFDDELNLVSQKSDFIIKQDFLILEKAALSDKFYLDNLFNIYRIVSIPDKNKWIPVGFLEKTGNNVTFKPFPELLTFIETAMSLSN